jgi:hypothetical protein
VPGPFWFFEFLPFIGAQTNKRSIFVPFSAAQCSAVAFGTSPVWVDTFVKVYLRSVPQNERVDSGADTAPLPHHHGASQLL